ncbi:MAG: class I SAM-dependent methyltransferase [Acidobacteriota bacterium]
MKDPCPACGFDSAQILIEGSDRLYGTTDRVFQVVECQACQLLRLHPWPTPTELRHYYPDDYWFVPEQDAVSNLEETYRRIVLRDHVNFVRKALEHADVDGPVLDVGCGGGLFLRMLSEKGRAVVGLDFALGAADAAWNQNGVPAVCGSLTQTPFATESFSAVTMFHVIEHLFDPVSYLEASHRLLKPGGRLVVQVPNASCWQFLLLGEAWNGVDIPRHLINYRAHDLEILLDRCGFEVTRTKYFSLRDNPAGLASSLAPGLDPMARRIRAVGESPRKRIAKDLLYLGLVMLSVPFTLLEAACHAGSTVMVEARKKA